MLWAVVHWVGENSFSAISENQVAEATVEEGETVSVTSKTSKGKSVIYKAVVEKVFGEYTYFTVEYIKIKSYAVDITIFGVYRCK